MKATWVGSYEEKGDDVVLHTMELGLTVVPK